MVRSSPATVAAVGSSHYCAVSTVQDIRIDFGYGSGCSLWLKCQVPFRSISFNSSLQVRDGVEMLKCKSRLDASCNWASKFLILSSSRYYAKRSYSDINCSGRLGSLIGRNIYRGTRKNTFSTHIHHVQLSVWMDIVSVEKPYGTFDRRPLVFLLFWVLAYIFSSTFTPATDRIHAINLCSNRAIHDNTRRWSAAVAGLCIFVFCSRVCLCTRISKPKECPV